MIHYISLYLSTVCIFISYISNFTYILGSMKDDIFLSVYLGNSNNSDVTGFIFRLNTLDLRVFVYHTFEQHARIQKLLSGGPKFRQGFITFFLSFSFCNLLIIFLQNGVGSLYVI